MIRAGDITARQAAEASLAQIKQQLTPAVRQKLMRRIANDFTAATQDDKEAG